MADRSEADGSGPSAKRERVSDGGAGGGGSGTGAVDSRVAMSMDDMPPEVPVVCNGVKGIMVLAAMRVSGCTCSECSARPLESRPQFHPTHWEQHCGECRTQPHMNPSKAMRPYTLTDDSHAFYSLVAGSGAAKKWKASIRVQPGGVAEVPAGGGGMTLGRWFDIKGVDFRPAKTLGGRFKLPVVTCSCTNRLL